MSNQPPFYQPSQPSWEPGAEAFGAPPQGRPSFSQQPWPPQQQQQQMGYQQPPFQQQQQQMGYQQPPFQQQQGMYAPQVSYQIVQPIYIPQPTESGREMAIAGFVLGLISMITWLFPCLNLIVPILGITFSALGLRSVSRRPLAIIGLILCFLSLMLYLMIALFALLLI